VVGGPPQTTTKKGPNDNTLCGGLDRLVKRLEESEREVGRVMEIGRRINDDNQSCSSVREQLELEEEAALLSQSPLFTYLKNAAYFEKMTNFSEEANLEHHRLCLPHWNKSGSSVRSRHLRISTLDHEILYKLFITLGDSFEELSRIVSSIPGIRWSNQLVCDAISRVRTVLEEALEEKWWTNRQRPIPLEDSSSFPDVGLLVGETPCEICKPLGYNY